MQQSSFVLSNKQYGSINIQRKDVNDQQFTIFQNQKTTKKKVKDKGVNSYKPLAKTTHSPKLPRTQQITPKQFPLEDCLSKNQALMIPKKTQNEIVPVEKVQDFVQSLKSQNYGATNLYIQELRKLSKMILNN
ncbi:unnamed protein product [Paramecium sonneborni]|uniref:Uncharacterized protein n=1 Tax=Paramecium sonneborni TaxID=65129 RepID=A0A8S1MJJ6_9CILI|nr:unnamed protein product [Paramecium sonneborni]